MSVEFSPGLEAETNQDGEIGFDAGECRNLEVYKDESFNISNIKRTEISDFGNEGFLLRKILTLDECKHIINAGEDIGFEKLIGVKDEYRSNQRVKAHVEDVTIDENPLEQHIHGIGFQLRGKWQPSGLNHIFRLCRYFSGGHFAPHFDGFYVKNTQERSLKTLMLYLNADFTGGNTNFVDESQQLYMDESGKYCAEEKNIRERIQPETGMAILFNHHRLHEGSQVGDGKKYILRTDIMYRKCGGSDYTPEEEKALQLLQQAERLEASGDCLKAAEHYKKAFKLSPSLEETYYNHK